MSAVRPGTRGRSRRRCGGGRRRHAPHRQVPAWRARRGRRADAAVVARHRSRPARAVQEAYEVRGGDRLRRSRAARGRSGVVDVRGPGRRARAGTGAPEPRGQVPACARPDRRPGWSAWSDALRVEAGLLDAADWVARPITLPGDPGRHAPGTVAAPAADVRRSTRRRRSARLHVTALGLHEVRINGRRRCPTDLLAPGLDRLPAAPARGHVRRHGPAPARARTSSARRSATAGTAAAWAASRRTTACTYGSRDRR